MNKYLYKYKGLRTKEDVVRLLDIIDNNRIYIPNYEKLNDPLEGQIIDIGLAGYAGIEMTRAADMEEPYLHDLRNKYKILSLSSECNNSVMWAHYGNDYDGVCLCFSTDKNFSQAKPVEYCKEKQEIFAGQNDRIISREILNGFFKKSDRWDYEKEWRIVQKTKNNYIQFDSNELCGIIVGHNISHEIERYLVGRIDERIRIMKTMVGHRSCGIRIISLHNRFVNNGRELKSLDVEKTLSKGKCVYQT